MFLEVHVLQNYVLSSLNRDDTGAPKTCIFGGTRRARISSQCLKRAVRTYVREESLVPTDLLSYRTKFLHKELVERLSTREVGQEKATQLADKALELLELKLKKGKTEYLLMLGEREIKGLVDVCIENGDTILSGGEGKSDKKTRGIDIGQQLLKCINGGQAVDMALFGRMIATHPDKGVDAAVQMAHAFSTHTVSMEFDFFSAVDDLQQVEDEAGAGAGMLGTTLYNSSCYYRYANIDLRQLMRNLNDDTKLVQLATRAFVTGMVYAVPTGKQTNSAPQNPPALVLMVLRDKGMWSLANAFVKPIYAGPKSNLVELSAKQLLTHWGQLVRMYGAEGIKYAGLTTYLPQEVTGDDNLGIDIIPNMHLCIEGVNKALMEAMDWGVGVDDASAAV